LPRAERDAKLRCNARLRARQAVAGDGLRRLLMARRTFATPLRYRDHQLFDVDRQRIERHAVMEARAVPFALRDPSAQANRLFRRAKIERDSSSDIEEQHRTQAARGRVELLDHGLHRRAPARVQKRRVLERT